MTAEDPWRRLGFLDCNPPGRPVPWPQKGIWSCQGLTPAPMLTVQASSPGGHAETPGTRPSGGSPASPAFIHLCALSRPFRSRIPMHGGGSPGNGNRVGRRGRGLRLSGPQCALLGNGPGLSQDGCRSTLRSIRLSQGAVSVTSWIDLQGEWQVPCGWYWRSESPSVAWRLGLAVRHRGSLSGQPQLPASPLSTSSCRLQGPLLSEHIRPV